MPVQHSERAQCDPTVRRSDGAGQFLVKCVSMSNVEQPAPVGLAPIAHGRKRLLDLALRPHPGRAQIVERTEHVVVPERRKRELRPRRIDDLSGRQPSEQTTLEEILLPARPRACHRWRAAERLLEREQSFEDADRRVERRAYLAALCLAIPSAIRQLLA